MLKMFSTESVKPTIYIADSPTNKPYITIQKRYCRNVGDESVSFENNDNNSFTEKTLRDDFNEKENELNYSRGIVQRLRQRFNQIADEMSKDIQISPFIRQKRYPSVGDILALSNQPYQIIEQKKVFEKNNNVVDKESIKPLKINGSLSVATLSKKFLDTSLHKSQFNSLKSNNLERSFSEKENNKISTLKTDYSNSINLLINQDSNYSTPTSVSKPQTSPIFVNSNIQKSANQVINDYNESAILKVKLKMNEFSTSDNNFINKKQSSNTSCNNKSEVAHTFSSLREKFERFSRAEKSRAGRNPSYARSQSAHADNFQRKENVITSRRKNFEKFDASNVSSPPSDPQPKAPDFQKASYAYVLPIESDNILQSPNIFFNLTTPKRKYDDKSPPPEEPFPTVSQYNIFLNSSTKNESKPLIKTDSTLNCVSKFENKHIEKENKFDSPNNNSYDLNESLPNGISEVYSLLNKFNASRKNRRLSPEPKQTVVAFEVPEYRAQLKKKVFNQSQNIDSTTNNANVEIYQKNFDDEFIVVSKKDIDKNIHNKCDSFPTFTDSEKIINGSMKFKPYNFKRSLPNSTVEKSTTNEKFLPEKEMIKQSTAINSKEINLNSDLILNEKKLRKSYSSMYFNNQENVKTSNQDDFLDVKKNLLTVNNEAVTDFVESENEKEIIDNNIQNKNEFINEKTIGSLELDTNNILINISETNKLLNDNNSYIEIENNKETNSENTDNKMEKIIQSQNKAINEIENTNLHNQYNSCSSSNISDDFDEEIRNWEAEDPFINIISKKNSDIFNNVKFDSQTSLKSNVQYLAQPKISILSSGNNILRNPLFNLVMEEDIPDLLEAMTETHSFVFEDLNMGTASSLNGIISLPEQNNNHKKRPKNANAKISFVDDPPQVFAYLDEESAAAETENQWHNGQTISFETYQKMVQVAQDDLVQQQLELTRWSEKLQNSDKTITNSISDLSLSSQSIDNTFLASCAEESKKNVYNNVNPLLQT